MDPNAALERIEYLLQLLGSEGYKTEVADELDTVCEGLQGWICNGGFEPRWEEHLEAAGHFNIYSESHSP